MALCRPVISTYVAGIPELVQAGDNGWLVPAGNVEAFAAAIQECLDSPFEKLQKMSDAGRARTALFHNVDLEVATLASLFKAGQT